MSHSTVTSSGYSCGGSDGPITGERSWPEGAVAAGERGGFQTETLFSRNSYDLRQWCSQRREASKEEIYQTTITGSARKASRTYGRALADADVESFFMAFEILPCNP